MRPASSCLWFAEEVEAFEKPADLAAIGVWIAGRREQAFADLALGRLSKRFVGGVRRFEGSFNGEAFFFSFAIAFDGLFVSQNATVILAESFETRQACAETDANGRRHGDDS